MSDEERRPAKEFVLTGECPECREQFGITVTWFGMEPENPRLVPIHKGPRWHKYRIDIEGDDGDAAR